jgi:predicted polyphosphate/ATP-dependent NAD kinase
MRAKLIVNPVSGKDAAPDALATINRLLRDRVDRLDIVMTVAAGDAIQLATQAVEEGVDHLFVCGGDGTLNEVVNGVAGSAAGSTRCRSASSRLAPATTSRRRWGSPPTSRPRSRSCSSAIRFRSTSAG